MGKTFIGSKVRYDEEGRAAQTFPSVELGSEPGKRVTIVENRLVEFLAWTSSGTRRGVARGGDSSLIFPRLNRPQHLRKERVD